MSASPGHEAGPVEELDRLLRFVHECPVGLIEIDDVGTVIRMNPAAARMLSPALAGRDPARLFPVLRSLDPALVSLATGSRQRRGPLGEVRRVALPHGPDTSLEVHLTRLDPGRVLITLVDVSEERRLAEIEHEVILSLQRSLLGRIDTVPGLEVGLTYRVADRDRQIGGDWYDVVALPGDRVGLVVGDVVGHHLEAAAAMGQLRSAVRSLALVYLDAAELLEHTEESGFRIEGAECTTVTYAVLERASGRLRYASAGHPPMLLAQADGTARFLWGGRERPLVCLEPVPRETAEARLSEGDLLVLYTDGLIERRDAALDDGLTRLLETTLSLRHLAVEELCDRLASSMLAGAEPEDDVCVLVVRYRREPGLG